VHSWSLPRQRQAHKPHTAGTAGICGNP
jgi:hypothetical protein